MEINKTDRPKTENVQKKVTFADENAKNKQSVGNVKISEKSGKCMYVSAMLEGQPCKMLIDTGSPVSILSEDVAQKIGIDIQNLSKTEVKLNGAEGSEISTKGVLECSLGLGSRSFAVAMIVAGLASYDGILGIDFLDAHDAKLNVKKRKLKIASETLHIESEVTPTSAKVAVVNDIVIPPESEMYIEGRLTDKLSERVCLVEPGKMLNGKQLLLARSLIDTSSEKFVLSVINTSRNEIKLRENTVIGYAYAVNEVCSEEATEPQLKTDILPDHLKPLFDHKSDFLMGLVRKKENANICLAKKTDGNWKLCIDRRNLNKARRKFGAVPSRQKKANVRLKPRKFEENTWVWRWYSPTAGLIKTW
ncbi:hypothetical protein FSP39_023181 [Pinctada imbricata]|uniref:Peptidase A2 domain-containing protein n=1 Tax=Pinctada imbricata TaxID=66713 RepID=A0AA89BUZ3_PINIB|nr:hypothetical protein FSP39_023181 [Pinctada imbricata]